MSSSDTSALPATFPLFTQEENCSRQVVPLFTSVSFTSLLVQFVPIFFRDVSPESATGECRSKRSNSTASDSERSGIDFGSQRTEED